MALDELHRDVVVPRLLERPVEARSIDAGRAEGFEHARLVPHAPEAVAPVEAHLARPAPLLEHAEARRAHAQVERLVDASPAPLRHRAEDFVGGLERALSRRAGPA